MLTAEENERLVRTAAGTPTGDLVRRFWIPFLQVDDLPAPDCDPVRVRLLGEDLVAFRDTQGRYGLVDKGCPHRLADLWFGRNEEGGLRCTYHGWKFDVTGRCLEAPTGPKEADFASKIRLTAYPKSGRACCSPIWAHCTCSPRCPTSSGCGCRKTTASSRGARKTATSCRLSRAASTPSIPFTCTATSTPTASSTSTKRRVSGPADECRRASAPKTTRPGYTHKTPTTACWWAVKYAGDQREDYWRYNLYLLPFYTMPPGSSDRKLCHAFVPIDDHTTARWSFTYSLTKPYTASEKADMRAGQGVHAALLPGAGHRPLRNKDNNYLIDREEQRKYTFTGIKGTGEQDFSVQEGMGLIVDRTREHLDVTDIGIIQMRRRMMKEATAVQEGGQPFAAHHAEVYRVHAGDALLPEGADWVHDERVQAALAPQV